MMLMTRNRSPSGTEAVQAIDYKSFVGRKERSQVVDTDIIHRPLESSTEKQLSEYQKLIFNPLLQQMNSQLHQQEHGLQHPHHHVKDPLSENRPRHGSFQYLDQPFEEQHDSQHHLQGNDQLLENRPRRGSLPPSEAFKDIILLDNDYFVAICDDYVKLYSDIGDLVHKLKLDYTPISLNRFGPDRVVIACHSRRLCVVSIDNGAVLSLQLEVKTIIQYSCVSQIGNDEFICVGLDEAMLHRLVYKPGLVVLASALPLANFGVTIRQDQSYRYVHVTSSGQIVITDRMNDYLLSVSVKGNWKIPFFYRPQAVASDDNHIYVIQGGGLNLVHRFNLDGTKSMCILRKEHSLADPWGLSLNKSKKMIVTSNPGNVPGVRVFTGLNV